MFHTVFTAKLPPASGGSLEVIQTEERETPDSDGLIYRLGFRFDSRAIKIGKRRYCVLNFASPLCVFYGLRETPLRSCFCIHQKASIIEVMYVLNRR